MLKQSFPGYKSTFLCEVHPSNLLSQSCHVKIVGFELKIIPITEISTIFILNYYDKSYQFNGSHYSVFSIVRPPFVRGFVCVCVHILVRVYMCVRTQTDFSNWSYIR